MSSSTSLIMIIVTSALISNVVLNQFYGICSFLGVSKQMKASASLGVAVIFVITIASAVASLLYDYVLKPLGMEFMEIIVFILVIAALVQVVEMFLKKKSPGVYKALGIYLPLITTNCAVLGVAINVVTKEFAFVPGGMLNLGQALVYAFATSLGYGLAMVIFTGIREHLAMNNVPKAFKGVPIAIVSVGILALAFMGFSGMVK